MSSSNSAPSAPPLLIAARGITKSYSHVPALAPLDLSVQEGERVALAGPSGSGKTTLLYLLGGVVQPGEGEVVIDGRPLRRLGPGKELAQLVGLVHQNYDLVPHLPVIHNVLAGMLGQWSLLRSAISLFWPRDRHLAERALAELGLGDKALERTSHLSGGEQQRVAIARLMVQAPRIILADEPVSSLDPLLSEEMLRLLTSLADSSGRTLVASLHSPRLIRKYFTRVIGLREGILQFDMPAIGLTDEVLAQLYDLNHHGELDHRDVGEAAAEVS